MLTHSSARYDDLAPLLAQAREVHPEAVLAQDPARVPVPARRPG